MKRMEKVADRLRISINEFVIKAIEKYIAHEEFNDVRNILLPSGKKAGFYSDEDIFKQFSLKWSCIQM